MFCAVSQNRPSPSPPPAPQIKASRKLTPESVVTPDNATTVRKALARYLKQQVTSGDLEPTRLHVYKDRCAEGLERCATQQQPYGHVLTWIRKQRDLDLTDIVGYRSLTQLLRFFVRHLTGTVPRRGNALALDLLANPEVTKTTLRSLIEDMEQYFKVTTRPPWSNPMSNPLLRLLLVAYLEDQISSKTEKTFTDTMTYCMRLYFNWRTLGPAWHTNVKDVRRLLDYFRDRGIDSGTTEATA
jgi:hypothetical protein